MVVRWTAPNGVKSLGPPYTTEPRSNWATRERLDLREQIAALHLDRRVGDKAHVAAAIDFVDEPTRLHPDRWNPAPVQRSQLARLHSITPPDTLRKPDCP
jgi:hypothetical protein